MKARLILMAGCVLWSSAFAGGDLANADLGEIDRKLNNPLTDLWSLTFQNNTSVKEGAAVDGKDYSNNLFFQPFLPFEIGAKDQVMLTLRPVFPLVTNPEFAGSSDHVTGLGDIQLLTLAGPNHGKGIVWGAGATFKFPTATDDALGAGKYQAGPAAMLFYMGKPWVGGILAQHWSSFAGDGNRSDTNQTDIQYIARRSVGNAMSVGLGPTITTSRKTASRCPLAWASPKPHGGARRPSSCARKSTIPSSNRKTTGRPGTFGCRSPR